jgi:hypothetical protein
LAAEAALAAARGLCAAGRRRPPRGRQAALTADEPGRQSRGHLLRRYVTERSIRTSYPMSMTWPAGSAAATFLACPRLPAFLHQEPDDCQ